MPFHVQRLVQIAALLIIACGAEPTAGPMSGTWTVRFEHASLLGYPIAVCGDSASPYLPLTLVQQPKAIAVNGSWNVCGEEQLVAGVLLDEGLSLSLYVVDDRFLELRKAKLAPGRFSGPIWGLGWQGELILVAERDFGAPRGKPPPLEHFP